MAIRTNEYEICQSNLSQLDEKIADLSAQLKELRAQRKELSILLPKLATDLKRRFKAEDTRLQILSEIGKRGDMSTSAIHALFEGWNPIYVISLVQELVSAGELIGIPGSHNAIRYSLTEAVLEVTVMNSVSELKSPTLEELVKDTLRRLEVSKQEGGRGLDNIDENRVVKTIFLLETARRILVSEKLGEGVYSLPVVSSICKSSSR